jgi:dTDP-3-amino-3,4,6-trideoxy-alpha-D-glucose transaminase
MKVRLNEFGRQWAVIQADAMTAFRRVGASGSYILGPEVERFEESLARSWPVVHAVATGNGLDALEIALRCLDIGPGELVLTTPLSAFATTLAVLRVGAVPVFCDVDRSGLLDLDLCRDLCARDRRIRALLNVHLYGHAADLDRLEALKRDFDLRLVEDCAQSVYATWDGRSTGTVGQIAATSFYPTKNLGALGDGGAVLTSSADLANRARSLRDYGQLRKYDHDEVGLNSRLDEVHAAVLRDAMLPRLGEWTERRAATAARYLEGIRSPWLRLPTVPAAVKSAWHLFPVLAPSGHRSSFTQHLRSRGVMTGLHYPRLIPGQRALARSDSYQIVTELTWAREFAENEVSLPIHGFLTNKEVEHIIASCNEWSPD